MYELGRPKYIIAALTCLTFLICATIVLALPFPEPLMTTEETRPASFDFENPAKRKTRCDWYRSRLGQYVSEINNAAAAARIPPELLATVILNELADVGVEDVEQDQAIAWTQGDYKKYLLDSEAGYIRVGRWWTQRPISSWSFGIAQIQPDTALRYNAVHVPPHLSGDRERTVFYVAFSLLNRTVNIHAAARVIKGILQDIKRYQAGPWARFFIRAGERFNAESPYAALKPPPSADSRVMHRERQRNLAQFVVAVYNSYGILTNTNPEQVPHPREVPSERKGDPEKYPNALLHSLNAQEIAEDLYASNACGMPLAMTSISWTAATENEGIFGTSQYKPGSLKGDIFELPVNTPSLPNFSDRKLRHIGTIYTKELNIPERKFNQGFPGVSNRIEWFAIRYAGRFYVSRPGTYGFRLLSDDGSRLFIDGRLTINNDGIHPPRSVPGKAMLKEGWHEIVEDYFQGPREHIALQLFVTPPNGTETIFRIP